MNIRRIILLSSLASVFTVFTLPASITYADHGVYQKHKKHKMCQHHKRHKRGHMHGMKYLSEQLDLSKEQKTKIAAIKAEKNSILQSLRKKKREIKNKLQQLDPKSPNFKNDVFSLAAEKGVISQRMVVEKGEMRFKIASLLTDQQLARKQEIRKQHKQGKHFCNYPKPKKGCHRKDKSKEQATKEIKKI